MNSAFNNFLFLFLFLFLCLFFLSAKFTIQTKEEELHIRFMIEIIMIIIKKTQKWESKAQSRFHVLQGLQMAVIFNLKISLSWSKPLTKFTCKIWAKSVGQSVRSFSISLLFYGLSLLIRPNQQLNKKFFSNRSVQEKSFATYITGNFWLKFANSITKREKLRKLSELFQMLFA